MKSLFVLVFVITFVLRLLPGNLQNMPFTMDQGRDLVDVRQIWQGTDIRLIGPTTSLNGVYLGPFYYYLISIPHLLSTGDPRSVLVWQIICFHLAVIFFWKTFNKQSSSFANFVSILLLVSPISFYSNRYFWNANFMPTFTILFLTLLINTQSSDKRSKNDYLLGLVAGISLQIEAAFGILFLPFSILFYLATKATIPRFSRLLVGFFVTLIPQIAFEFSKYFPMTKVFLNEISGNTSTLGEKLSGLERLSQRKESFISAFNQSSHISPNYLLYLLIICLLIFIFYRGKSQQKVAKSTSTITLFFLLFSILFYFVYPAIIKSWYIFSISLIFSLLIGSSLALLDPNNSIYKVLTTLVLVASFIAVFRSQKEYLTSPSYKSPNDPSAFTNQIKIVDDIYRRVDGGSFYVYNYIPSVYDYPFQYLFWSHGLKKYGYSPNDLAYLPNQPEYIKSKNSYLKNLRPVTNNTPTILIIQEGDNKTHLQEWMGNFAYLCKEAKTEYSFGQKVLYLKPCSVN